MLIQAHIVCHSSFGCSWCVFHAWVSFQQSVKVILIKISSTIHKRASKFLVRIQTSSWRVILSGEKFSSLNVLRYSFSVTSKCKQFMCNFLCVYVTENLQFEEVLQLLNLFEWPKLQLWLTPTPIGNKFSIFHFNFSSHFPNLFFVKFDLNFS